jgi:hypothetical protein
VRKVPVQKTRIEYKIIKTNVCVKQPVKKTQQPVKKSSYY